MGSIDFEKVRPLKNGMGDDAQMAAVINKIIRNQEKLITLIDNPFDVGAADAPTDEEIVAAAKKSTPGSCKENSIGMDLQSTVTVEKIEEKEAPQ